VDSHCKEYIDRKLFCIADDHEHNTLSIHRHATRSAELNSEMIISLTLYSDIPIYTFTFTFYYL